MENNKSRVRVEGALYKNSKLSDGIALTILYSGGMSVTNYGYSAETQAHYIGLTLQELGELSRRLLEIYQNIVMQEELNLDKMQSGIMEAKQVEQEVKDEAHN